MSCDVAQHNDYSELTLGLFDKGKDAGENQEQLLSMLSHRYLTNQDVLNFVNQGVKNSGQKISKIENVLKPELVAAFETRWNGMTQKIGANLTKPCIAYHGTAETNINSILEKGLLVPGKGDGKTVQHATDSGWWGGGIYLSPDSSLSIGYCRGGKKLLICSVIMGRRFNVTERMDGADLKENYDSHVACNGTEWVLFEPSQVLPCYLVSFVQ
jgi:aprataxin and PNK-like factor